MTREEKLQFYHEMRIKIGKDGKSHMSMMTKDGVVIDGKKYLPKRR